MSLLQELVAELGLSANEIRAIISTAPARYKIYNITKRDGIGLRTIAQPSQELKAIQHYILYNKILTYPIHSSSMAYVRKKNIRQNAERHLQSKSIMKMDFEQFFPSIKVSDWERFAKRTPNDKILLEELKLYSKIMFWGKSRNSIAPTCLSIGAPTSPILSNILLYDLDVLLSNEATKIGTIYTRYADDITASGETLDQLIRFERAARRIIRNLKSPKLTFNESKFGIYTKGQRRLVTGLVLTPEGKISVGRERKRLISAMLHRQANGLLDLSKRSQLKGLLGSCIANEPDFLGRLRKKYGSPLVSSALRFHAPKRSQGNETEF